MRFIFTIIFFTLSSFCFSQTSTISRINEQVLNIQNNLNLLTKTEKINADTDQKVIFSDTKNVELITVRTRNNSIEKKVSWFYSNGKYIYAEQTWSNPEGIVINNEKLYFNENRLIQWIKTDGSIINTDEKEFIMNATALYDFGMSLIE
ncbi:MAG: hypothetical protein ACXVO9_15385 [Bacteroidia bacterium]